MTANDATRRFGRWVTRVVAGVVGLVFAGVIALLLAGQVGKLESYQKHQIAHILRAARASDVRALLGANAEDVAWSVRLSDDDPRVCELTLDWQQANAHHSARWVVLHEVSWTARISFIEVAALNEAAHDLTPAVQRRDSLRGSVLRVAAPATRSRTRILLARQSYRINRRASSG
jgi:hypothetical protein